MKYMLLVYGNEEIWSSYSQEEFQAIVAEQDQLNRDLHEEGILLGAYGVADQAAARMVTVDAGGQRIVTDGPYVETKEYVGSFYIVDVADEEEALAIAARIPNARDRGVEVRALPHEG